MTPSQELDGFRRGFPSAYPNTETALAWVLCVPGTGYGWYEYQGKSEIYGESHTRKRVRPAIWEMYAQGDDTIRRYIEAMGTRNRVPITMIPENATPEWVDQCRALIKSARRVGVSAAIQKRLDRIETNLEVRGPDPAKVEREANLEALRIRFQNQGGGENDVLDKLLLENIRHTLARNEHEATYRTPKIEAAIAALDTAGIRWAFAELPRETHIRWQVAALSPRTRVLGAPAGDGREEMLARQILTSEEFAQWQASDAWGRKTRSLFLTASGEQSMGPDPEILFYRALLHVQSAPWTWPLIEPAIEIFGEPLVEGRRLTFTPLEPPYAFNETTQGIHRPRRVYPYRYDYWQSGDLPAYKPATYFTWEQLLEGIVVSIGPKRYRVSYPLVAVWLKHEAEKTYAEYEEYPNPQAPVILEETEDPITPPKARTSSPEFPVQFFGTPHWVQNPRFPVWKGKTGHVLFSLHDGWGDGGSTNILFCQDEDGAPVRIFHEASCS